MNNEEKKQAYFEMALDTYTKLADFLTTMNEDSILGNDTSSEVFNEIWKTDYVSDLKQVRIIYADSLSNKILVNTDVVRARFYRNPYG